MQWFQQFNYHFISVFLRYDYSRSSANWRKNHHVLAQWILIWSFQLRSLYPEQKISQTTPESYVVIIIIAGECSTCASLKVSTMPLNFYFNSKNISTETMNSLLNIEKSEVWCWFQANVKHYFALKFNGKF